MAPYVCHLASMALDILLTLIGTFIAPIIIVLALALFIHCVLTLHRNRERRAFRTDSLLTPSLAIQPQSPLAEESLV